MPSSGLGDLLAVNISAPGLSMLFPHIHCLADYSVCQVTTGEAEINAAATMMAVGLSDKLDLTNTYFLIGGIAGVNPKHSTLGSVALTRYAVQVALQYEFDAREMPENFSTGYFPLGPSHSPDQLPGFIYGSEVMELNEALRDIAYTFAAKAQLADNHESKEYRKKYREREDFAAATLEPSIIKCDSATSDVYYSGTLLSEAFENITAAWTNSNGVYCMTAQEDNATLEVLVRMAIEGLVDFSRVMIVRTGTLSMLCSTTYAMSGNVELNLASDGREGANFDRPPPGISAFDHLLALQQNGFAIAIQNIYLAGIEIVKGILQKWNCTFARGIEPTNYIGDIFGSLGGKPDFGPGSLTNGLRIRAGGENGHLVRRG